MSGLTNEPEVLVDGRGPFVTSGSGFGGAAASVGDTVSDVVVVVVVVVVVGSDGAFGAKCAAVRLGKERADCSL